LIMASQPNMKFSASSSRPKQRVTLRSISHKKQLPIIIVASTPDDKWPQTKNIKLENGEEESNNRARKSQNPLRQDNNSAVIYIPSIETIEPGQTSLEMRRTQILIQRNNERKLGLVAEVELPYKNRGNSYTLDEKDAMWLEIVKFKSISIPKKEFESAMETLEINSRYSVIKFPVFYMKLPEISKTKLSLIYDYWLDKRTKVCKLLPSATLLPYVPDFSNDENDPYVAFRPRDNSDLNLDPNRKQSVRIARQKVRVEGPRKRNRKSIEELAEERAAVKLEQMSYEIGTNSELDGRFSLKRIKNCSYIKIENE